MNTNDEFEIKLNILADILEKKKTALGEVLAISQNQESVYDAPASAERRDFLVQMGQEKQKRIDDVIKCDDAFQSIFDGIKNIFEQKGKEYPEKVRALQISISETLEMDVKIRAQEEKTRLATQAAWGQRAESSDTNEVAKNRILAQYKDNNRNRPR